MKYVLALVFLLIILVGIKQVYAFRMAQNSCFENINNEIFKAKMQQTQEVVILDVCTVEEFQEGNITGAKNIDVNQQNFKANINQLDKDNTYLVYCRSGMRSLKASNILCAAGFTKVYNLSNGYLGWEE